MTKWLQIVLLTNASFSQELALKQVIPLHGDTHHVQGVEVEDISLWVTSVDTSKKAGLLFEFDLTTGTMRRSVELQKGGHYHPGGLMSDGDSLWIPVAEYKRNSSAVIQRRSKRTLELQSEFIVTDHIGAVAVVPEGLAGVNWDARDIYVWTKDGKLIRKISNPSGVAIQDMKFVNGELVGGGLLPDKAGAIVWFEWPSLNIKRKLNVGRTDRNMAYTHEGMAIKGNKLYFVPEDSSSRLFVFSLNLR